MAQTVTASSQINVLRVYRHMRAYGRSPHATMLQVRESYANAIAVQVAAGHQPADDVINAWRAADTYSRVMVTRTPWWFTPRPAAAPAAPAAPPRRRTMLVSRIRRMITLCP